MHQTPSPAGEALTTVYHTSPNMRKEPLPDILAFFCPLLSMSAGGVAWEKLRVYNQSRTTEKGGQGRCGSGRPRKLHSAAGRASRRHGQCVRPRPEIADGLRIRRAGRAGTADVGHACAGGFIGAFADARLAQRL